MTRSGTVILLGAGASRDALYPLASDMHEPFLEAVEKASFRDIEFRKQAEAYFLKHGVTAETIPKGEHTILEWFQTRWVEFVNATGKIRPLAVPEFRADGRPKMPSQVIRDTSSGFPAHAPYPAFVEGERERAHLLWRARIVRSVVSSQPSVQYGCMSLEIENVYLI